MIFITLLGGGSVPVRRGGTILKSLERGGYILTDKIMLFFFGGC